MSTSQQQHQQPSPGPAPATDLRKRSHARRTCLECRAKRTRCDLPDASVPFGPDPLSAALACHRCKTLGVTCIVSDAGLKRKKKGDKDAEATPGPSKARVTSSKAGTAAPSARKKQKSSTSGGDDGGGGDDDGCIAKVEPGSQIMQSASPTVPHARMHSLLSAGSPPLSGSNGHSYMRAYAASNSSGGTPGSTAGGSSTTGGGRPVWVRSTQTIFQPFAAPAPPQPQNGSMASPLVPNQSPRQALAASATAASAAPSTSSGVGVASQAAPNAPPVAERLKSVNLFTRRPLFLLSDLLLNHEGFADEMDRVPSMVCPTDVLVVVDSAAANAIEARALPHLLYFPALPELAALRADYVHSQTLSASLLLSLLYLLTLPPSLQGLRPALHALVAREGARVLSSAPRDMHAIAALELLAVNCPLILASSAWGSSSQGGLLANTPGARVSGEGFLSVALSIAHALKLDTAPRDVDRIASQLAELPPQSGLGETGEPSLRAELERELAEARDDATQWYSLCTWRAHVAWEDHDVRGPVSDGLDALKIICDEAVPPAHDRTALFRAAGRMGLAGRIIFLETALQSWHDIDNVGRVVEDEIKRARHFGYKAPRTMWQSIGGKLEDFERRVKKLDVERSARFERIPADPCITRLADWLSIENNVLKALSYNHGFCKVLFGPDSECYVPNYRSGGRRAASAPVQSTVRIVNVIRDTPWILGFSQRWGTLMQDTNEIVLQSFIRYASSPLPSVMQTSNGASSREGFAEVVGMPIWTTCSLVVDTAKSCTESQAATIIGWRMTSPRHDSLTSHMRKTAASLHRLSIAMSSEGSGFGSNGPDGGPDTTLAEVFQRVREGNLLATCGLIVGAMADAMEEWRTILQVAKRATSVGREDAASRPSSRASNPSGRVPSWNDVHYEMLRQRSVSAAQAEGTHAESSAATAMLALGAPNGSQQQQPHQHQQQHHGSAPMPPRAHPQQHQQHMPGQLPSYMSQQAAQMQHSQATSFPYSHRPGSAMAQQPQAQQMTHASMGYPSYPPHNVQAFPGPSGGGGYEMPYYTPQSGAPTTGQQTAQPTSSAVELMLVNMLGDEAPDWTTLLTQQAGSHSGGDQLSQAPVVPATNAPAAHWQPANSWAPQAPPSHFAGQ